MKFEIENETEPNKEIIKVKLRIDTDGDVRLMVNGISILFIDKKTGQIKFFRLTDPEIEKLEDILEIEKEYVSFDCL